MVASKIYLFLLLSSKCESPYKIMSFLSLSGKDSKYQLRILHYSYDLNDIVKNDGSAVANAM